MNHSDYHIVTLAGLLHDVGKLVRSQSQGRQRQQPYGRAGGREGGHAQDGVNFLQHVGVERLPQWATLRNLIAHHHQHNWQSENRTLGWIVSSSDWYSSRERIVIEREETDRPHLESIFRQVQTVYPLPVIHYFQAQELEASSAFPQAQPPQFNAFNKLVDSFEAESRALLESVQDLRHLLVGFTDLLARYTTVTNADKRTFPFDVSLFDHLSTTAAIAACQYLYHAGMKRWDEAELQDEAQEKFLLIGGDLSGIQRYLYEIAQTGEGGVAKRLRARSFYLTALLQVIAFRLCQELVEHLGVSLPPNCQLINTGGRFLLLAPNLPEVSERLMQLDREINTWLRSETHGDLACYFTAVPLRGQDFIPEIRLELEENPPGSSSITRKIDEVYQRLNIAKQGRYHQLLHGESGWQDVFVQRTQNVVYPPGDGRGEGGACRSCRKLPVDPDVVHHYGRSLCRHCNEDLELGRFLLRTAFVAYRRGEIDRHEEAFDLTFFPRDQRYTMRLAATPAPLDPFAPQHVEYLAIDRDSIEDETAYERRQMRAVTTSYRHPTRRRYLANYVPLDGEEIVSFDGLAERCGRAEQQGEVEPLVGVVKMDVDQLGLLVAEGLGKVTSIARVATFSRMLDLFFSGWIDTKLRRLYVLDEKGRRRRDNTGQPEANPFRNIYTVYAGGDDLLLVGPWDTAVRAARELQADFRRFTNDNPNLTVSVSVVVIKPRYPVAKAAQQATQLLEEHAKRAGRNRFHLFGITVPWYARTPEKSNDPGENQLRQALTDGANVPLDPSQAIDAATLWDWAEFFDEELYKYRQSRQNGVERYPVSNILLHRMLRLSLASQRIAAAGVGPIDDLTYMAHLAYFLGRSIDAEQYPDLLRKLMPLTLFNQVRLMAHLQMPLTWALYRNRQRS